MAKKKKKEEYVDPNPVVFSCSAAELERIYEDIKEKIDGGWDETYPVDNYEEHHVRIFKDGTIDLMVKIEGFYWFNIEK